MKHFSFSQFAVSTKAKQLKIDNSVPPNLKSHAEELVNTILDPLTDAWGSSIIMTSGYRCPALNKAIGGAQNSAHSYAYAADLVPSNGKTTEFKNFAIQWLYNSKLPFDQLIDEYNSTSSWLHIGVRNGSNKQRKQWLKYYSGKYTSIDPRLYTAGGNNSSSNNNTHNTSNQQSNNGSSSGGSGISDSMLQYICRAETGKTFGYSMVTKDLQGYDLGDANGHRTFGYGLLYHPNNQYMDSVKTAWTQGELEQLFKQVVQNKVNTIKKWASKNNLTLNQNQIDALTSACYNFGIGFLTKSGKTYSSTVSLIIQNPNNPEIKNSWSHMSDAQGKKFPGLITRRKKEADWYFGTGATATDTNYSPNTGDSNSGSSSSYNNTGGGYTGGGSGSTPKDTRQYNSINVTQIKTGGNTQTGSTEGLLTGRSVYLKGRDEYAMKSNAVFSKDENGELMFDENGLPIVNDDYLMDGNEKVSDTIDSIDELPKEPVLIDMGDTVLDDVETVRGILYNANGTYVVQQSKTIQEILAMVQKWYEMVQSFSKIDFKHIDDYIKKVKEEEAAESVPSLNAMVYMKAAFDMYGHAYREGMTCPICGKHKKYLPPGGYCSVECLLQAAKDKSLAFLMAPNKKYAWLQDIINQLCAILDLTNLLINSIVLIPDIVKELAQLPYEYKSYAENKIADGFTELQELIQKAMKKKNELLEQMLKPINLGVVAKPVAMAFETIDLIRNSLIIAQDAFNMAYDIVKQVISKLTTIPNTPPGLVLPAESFAWALTPRSFICPTYPSPVNSDMGKIFVNLPGGLGIPIQGVKPLMPSALQNINIEAIDKTIQDAFPPLTPADYYLEPDLFEIRYLFSDQSDLVLQIRQQLEDVLTCGPDYLPKFENLLPIKEFTIKDVSVYLPNLGYVWFLTGLSDAWAPHSKALVGSIINPAI